MATAEEDRLAEKSQESMPLWRKWGPYVSERSWGTAREDYSSNGDAWNFFPFDISHQKVYRWGEDGIAGFCDRYQVLVFAPAFWNGKDPILKERLFGLASLQGNHGEDVKECYYYLDALPTHSYMKYLYKYPQGEFPYEALKAENGRRSLKDPEYEITDTGAFADGRYFDIFIEYAKASPEDLCIRIEAINRGSEAASLHIIPQLWFRNQWSWWDRKLPEPVIYNDSHQQNTLCLIADDSKMLSPPNLAFDYHLNKRYLYATEGGKPLFTNNENAAPNQPFSKDAFHRAIIKQEASTNPEEKGTKAAIHYFFPSIPAHGSTVVYLRLTDAPSSLKDIEEIFAKRRKEADEFYAKVHPPKASPEEKKVQRGAIAGMIWSKQFYYFDVNQWFEGDNTAVPPPPLRDNIRNKHWRHLNSMRILSMPDKWEYPWFAAWDLAFHTLTIGLVDLEFAKEQLWLLLFDQFQHPNGAIPAYEWEFSDLNPPVQAWTALHLYKMEKEKTGNEDRAFLKKCFLKLVINFTYWVNRVDVMGNNVFEGGFLGLDNIALFDRSEATRFGLQIKQSDGTAWMAMFALNLMRMALELAKEEHAYESLAVKFFQHFVYIAHAMKMMGNKRYSLWDDKDHFFYDIVVYPDGNYQHFRIRSLVGLIPLFAIEIISSEELEQFPEFKRDFLWFIQNRKNLTKECVFSFSKGKQTHYALSLVNRDALLKMLDYLWDPEEFRSDYGIRSLSKYHEKSPFNYKDLYIGYEPAESIHRIKGGNSNWRGPIWFPINFMILESLKEYYKIYGNRIKIKVGEENSCTIEDIVKSLSNRLISLFTVNASGIHPYNTSYPFAQDPHFQHLQFYEHFHGDSGRGLGSSHQTGWTSLVANIIDDARS